MKTPALAKLGADIAAARAKNPSWLYGSVGKRILKEAAKLMLRWPKMERLFSRSQRTLEKAFSYHGVRKERPMPARYVHSDRVISIIRRYYAVLSEAANSAENSVAWRNRMMAEVNERRRLEKLEPTTLNAVRCLADTLGLKWGWRKTLSGTRKIQTEAAIRAAEDEKWLQSLNEK